jgi:hypothetical protein
MKKQNQFRKHFCVHASCPPAFASHDGATVPGTAMIDAVLDIEAPIDAIFDPDA